MAHYNKGLAETPAGIRGEAPSGGGGSERRSLWSWKLFVSVQSYRFYFAPVSETDCFLQPWTDLYFLSMGGSCLCLNQPVAFTSCMKWQAP